MSLRRVSLIGLGSRGRGSDLQDQIFVGDTLMAARSRPNNDWGSVGNGAKSRRKARKWWLWYV